VTPSTENYEPFIAVVAEGRRLGLMTCRRCGATVMLEGAGGGMLAPVLHDEWHHRLAQKREKATE
jgi:hypothetical protein